MRALSIIIPCYNCEKTLEEAVASCFRQGLSGFEVVLVDDASADSTRDVMRRLAAKHPEVKAHFHDKNLGGGAARNTAVSRAENDAVFCLDSDDMLADGTLAKMLAMLEEKGCDGVGVARSVKFRGSDARDVAATHDFMKAGAKVELDDLLERDGLCSLYSTFMFTKAAFERSGGYPTGHGFDTQGFAWRFLAAGNVAYTCPGATYLHRVHFSESYYLREANGGRINYNWFEVLDEHFSMLPKKAQEKALYFDYRDITRNVFDEVKACTDRLSPKREVTDPKGPFEEYVAGSAALRRGDLVEAERLLLLANQHRPSPVIREKLRAVSLLRSGLDAQAARAQIERERRYVRARSARGLGMRLRRKAMDALRGNAALKAAALSLHHAREDVSTRLKARHSAALIGSWAMLKLEKLVRYRFPADECPAGRATVDLVIPTLPKDQELLDAYLACARENLCERIANIYIVAPKDASIERFCADRGIQFVDERSVLGYGKEAISYSVNGQNRSGWLFQQLLKLSGDSFVKSSRYVIVDSDTLLIRKHAFFEAGKSVFVENSEWNEPYFRSFERLFGYEAPTRRSLTSHMMIFDLSFLAEMKREIEAKHGMPWDRAYVEAADRTVSSGISDYEVYANWALYNHPDETDTKPFYNGSYSRKLLGDLPSIKERARKRHASISFHSYNG